MSVTRTAGDRPARGAPASRAGRAATGGPTLVLLLLILLLIPLSFHIGSIRLAPHRLLLLATFVPLFFSWMGKGLKAPDVLLLLYCVWLAVALIANHGLSQIEFIAISTVETLGPYMIARLGIRNEEDFRKFAKYLLVCMLVLLPFVAFEAIASRRVLSELLGIAIGGMSREEMRWGMLRAQGSFGHPILLGVFASGGFALLWYVYAATRDRTAGWRAALAAGLVNFFALSMGGYISIMFQGGLMAYDRLAKGKDRWKLLVIVMVSIYLFLSVASNRGPGLILAQTLAFNEYAAATRLLTWQYGSAVALANPLFGIGLLEDWQPRPYWLTPSVDNFWLLTGMRYGLPGALLIIAAFAVLFLRMAKKRIADPVVAACRKGLLITLAGIFLAICTVHLWDTAFCFLMLLVGSGAWIMDLPDAPKTAEAEGGAPSRGGRPAASSPDAPPGARPHARRAGPDPKPEARDEGGRRRPIPSSRPQAPSPSPPEPPPGSPPASGPRRNGKPIGTGGRLDRRPNG